MNFAKEQLKKHGWKAGSGLGKDETGIKEPVKAKIKNDTRGVGHDSGKEFTFHWWDHMFNKAASSIQVETTENGIQVKKTESSDKHRNKKTKTYDNKALLYDQFVKGATLSDGRYQAEKTPTEHEESDHEEPSKSSIIPANEEKLFKQCGGRTAHKGARHGLKLNGKLARIEQQEQELLERLKQNSASQNTENNIPQNNDDTGQKSENRRNSADLNGDINTEYKEKKKRKYVDTEARNLECAENTEETCETHTKTCKKKRKKDKHKRKSKSDLLENSYCQKITKLNSDEIEANNETLSKMTDTNIAEDLLPKKSKKKKKKKDRKCD